MRFGGSDSSPQCGFDFLLSSCDFISEENVRPLFQRVLRMIEECETRKQAGDTYEQSAESAGDHAFLRKHLRKGDFTPAALGNRPVLVEMRIAVPFVGIPTQFFFILL